MHVTEATVRAELYTLKIGKHRNIDAFSDRFNAIVRKYDKCGSGEPLSYVKLQSAFYDAVAPVRPEIKTILLFSRMQNNKELTIDQIKSFFLQLEAENRRSVAVQANMAISTRGQPSNRRGESSFNPSAWQNGLHANCFRCSQTGHEIKDCPLNETNQFYCYICRKNVDHKGTNCPRRNDQDRYKNKNAKSYTSNTSKHFNNKTYGNKQHFYNNKQHSQNNQYIRGRGNFRGRVSKSRPRNMTPQERSRFKYVNAKLAGKLSKTTTSNNNISFIADSGASEHIINKAFILDDFQQCKNKIIKSANKNVNADISIDGQGNLIVVSNVDENDILYLPNVILPVISHII